MSSIQLNPLQSIIVNTAKEKKATRIVMLDLKGISDLCDFQFICSAQNEKQAQAIADAMLSQTKQLLNLVPMAVEGKERGHWVVLDYGSVIVHIFFDFIRDYYGLESLWAKGTIINFS